MLNGGRVVVVGGGIVGLSIAFHLAEAGYRDVLVIERGLVGEGATAKATGGIRTQFSSRVNIELAQRSVRFWETFTERTGAPLDFRRHGYLFLLSDERTALQFADAYAMQRECGVAVDWLAPDRVADVFPGVRTDDLVAGVHTPLDGSASPTDAVAGFARAAHLRGVRIRQRCAFTGLIASDASVLGVQTDRGVVEAEAVVLAPGPYAASVGQLCDLYLPVEPHPRQAFSAHVFEGIEPSQPLTVDLATGAYVHPGHGGSAVVGGNDRMTAPSEDAQVDWSRMESLAGALSHRFPALAEMSVRKGWSGLREMTPDDHGIVGPVPSMSGLWVAAGFSGHGFMQAPAVGEQLARWMIHGEPDLDLRRLGVERFAPGARAFVEESVIF